MTWYETFKGGHRAVWRESDGKRKKGPKRPTKEEAQQWAIANGHDEPPNQRLSETLDEWIALRRSERNVSETYLRNVQDILTALFARRGWVFARDITKDAIDRWRLDTNGVGVSRPLAYLLSVLRYLRQERERPMDSRLLIYRLPRQRRKVVARRMLTSDQVRSAIEEAASWGEHAHGIIHYLSVYGARPATACQLRIRDVDFGASPHAVLTLSAKTSGEWQHPLLDATAELFAQCAHGRDPSETLFLCPYTGRNRFARRLATRPWRLTRYGGAIELGRWYSTHIGKKLPDDLATSYHLKRYAITTMLRAGIDPRTIALFTGHLTVAQILTYARADEVSQRGALVHLVAGSHQDWRWRAIDLPPLPAPIALLVAPSEETATGFLAPGLPPQTPPPAPSEIAPEVVISL